MRVRGGDYIRGGTPGSRLRGGTRPRASGIVAPAPAFTGWGIVAPVTSTPEMPVDTRPALAGVAEVDAWTTMTLDLENGVVLKEWVSESGPVMGISHLPERRD